jgi:V8-like Glu-specific endopeptidase
LIDDPARQFLTAGHCVDGADYAEVMEFNVPLSNGDGSWNHPGTEDQYPVDPVSIQFAADGIGDDWCYFGCFPNTETGLTAYGAQGTSHILAAAAPPVDGRAITITGYGSTSWPVDPTWYGVQKTHTGPYMHNSGWNVGYQTDTTGGNSGSPVLDETTGLAIGIHSHAGCDSGGGYNNGTAIEHASLQHALANPLGVCIPNILNIEIAGSPPQSTLPGEPFTLQFSVEAGDEQPIPESVRLAMNINGPSMNADVTAVGGDVYEADIPAFACGDDVSWFIEATGDGGGVATLPHGAPGDQYHLLIGTLTETVIFEADFNGGLPAGWLASGFWHEATTACAGSDGCGEGGVMYFGQDATCDYDDLEAVSGALRSPVINLDGVAGPYQLSFCSHLETENESAYDIAQVELNSEILERTPDGGWQTRVIDIDSISGDTATISFTFDSVDDFYNTYTGWHIDGVQLVAQGVDCTDPDPCAGDVDGSGFVDTDDLLVVILFWGAAGSPADVNGDGTVGTDDLLAIIAAWGPC